MNTTENEIIRQWLESHWEEFCDWWRSKTKDASQVEKVTFDSERHTGVLMVMEYQGVRKVIQVTPESLIENLTALDEEIRQRCIDAAQSAEDAADLANTQAEYAEGQGDRIEALITEISDLMQHVGEQGDTAEAQGAAAEDLRIEIQGWYDDGHNQGFKPTAESWYSQITSTVANWFSGVQTSVSQWFEGVVQDVSDWFDEWQARVAAFFSNMSTTWDDMTFMFSDTVWNPNTTYLRNKATRDAYGNWWVSLKSTVDEPNINHPIPGFDSEGQPIASEWWKLWIDWQHPMAQILNAIYSADESTGAANNAAERANTAAQRAEELDIVDHENRIASLESQLQTLTTDDLVAIRSAISSLQSLIGADVDSTINKFNEIVSFLAGIGPTETLQQLLADIAAQIAAKQDAGDYATNSRVDALESRVNTLASPRFVGDTLVFPAESKAKFEDDTLILTQ